MNQPHRTSRRGLRGGDTRDDHGHGHDHDHEESRFHHHGLATLRTGLLATASKLALAPITIAAISREKWA